MPRPKTDPKTGDVTVELTEPERRTLARAADLLGQIAFHLAAQKPTRSESYEEAAGVIRMTLAGESPIES